MDRIFGRKTPKKPTTLDDASGIVNKQAEYVESKIKKLDEQLSSLKIQRNNAKTPSARKIIESKALRIMKQRKLYENQLIQQEQTAFNLDNVNFAVQNAQNAVTITDAIATSTKVLKKNLKQINIDKVESITDDIQDLMEEANEINHLLGTGFSNENYDEEDLLEEFDQLETMCFDNGNTGNILDEIGIDKELPSANTGEVKQPSSQKVELAAQSGYTLKNGIKVDEFGLPIE